MKQAIESGQFVTREATRTVIELCTSRIGDWMTKAGYTARTPGACVAAGFWIDHTVGQICVLNMDVTVYFYFVAGHFGFRTEFASQLALVSLQVRFYPMPR